MSNIIPEFTGLDPSEIAIDQPTFKASRWQATMCAGELIEISTCFDLIGGRWEGFVSMRKFGGRKRKPARAPAPAPILVRVS